MSEIVKNALLAGIGLAITTRDKIEELGRELIEMGEVTETEGRQFVDDLLKCSEEAQKDLVSLTEARVKDAVFKLNIATKADIADLTRRIEQIEARDRN